MEAAARRSRTDPEPPCRSPSGRGRAGRLQAASVPAGPARLSSSGRHACTPAWALRPCSASLLHNRTAVGPPSSAERRPLPPTGAEDARPRRWSSWRWDLLVIVGFAAVSFAYFGVRLVPHPGRVILGDGADNEIFVWSFAWWPHAILHGHNPFVTHALFAPSGANLAWVSSVPALALAFSPVTLLFGPVVSFNLAALLLPALAAWAAYRLCLALTGSLWSSIVGGYLFGFSSFILAQQQLAHLNLTGDLALPLIALALVRLVRRELSRRRFALRFGALIALQLAISTEVALTLTFALAVALALASALAHDVRFRLRALLPAIGLGYCLGALFAAPLVVYALLGFPDQGFVLDPAGTDLLNLFFPTHLNAIAGSSFRSLQVHFNPHESAIFLGLPTLLIVALYAWRTRRSGWSRFLIAGLAAAVLFALGPTLVVDGRSVASLPWALLEHLPGFDDVHTPRFGAYASLAAAVIVALWTARARGRVFRRPFVLPVLAVAALLPTVWTPLTVLHPERPAFFSSGAYKTCIRPGETVALFPNGGAADYLQVETGFRFPVAGGYLSPIISGAHPIISFNSDPTITELNFWSDRGVPDTDALRAFAARHGVDRFVSIAADGYPGERELRGLGPVQRIGGVYVAPACGQPSLATRPLPASTELMLTEQQHGVSIAYCHDGYTIDLPVGLRPAGQLAGATRAAYVAGSGLTCSVPSGYSRRGFAPTSLGVPARTYPYYER